MHRLSTVPPNNSSMIPSISRNSTTLTRFALCGERTLPKLMLLSSRHKIGSTFRFSTTPETHVTVVMLLTTWFPRRWKYRHCTVLEKCVSVRVGDEEGGRKVWVYPATSDIIVSNLSVTLYPNEKSREIWNYRFTNTHVDTFRNNLWIISSFWERGEKERDSTLKPGFPVYMYTQALFLTLSNTFSHHKTTHTQENVCVCVNVCCWLQGEQPPTVSVYVWGSLTRQPRAD